MFSAAQSFYKGFMRGSPRSSNSLKEKVGML